MTDWDNIEILTENSRFKKKALATANDYDSEWQQKIVAF